MRERREMRRFLKGAAVIPAIRTTQVCKLALFGRMMFRIFEFTYTVLLRHSYVVVYALQYVRQSFTQALLVNVYCYYVFSALNFKSICSCMLDRDIKWVKPFSSE